MKQLNFTERFRGIHFYVMFDDKIFRFFVQITRLTLDFIYLCSVSVFFTMLIIDNSRHISHNNCHEL